MDKYSRLTSEFPLSKDCIAKGLFTYDSVLQYVKQLPYGRSSNRSDYTSVLKEGKGTCSTKHALLKAIAIENQIEDLELYLGIFKMNAENTPKIKSILLQNNLEYIPEAHCYLKVDDDVMDVTFPHDSNPIFMETLVYEETILPEHIGNYKIECHQAYLKSWIATENLPFSFNDIWKIREQCIRALSA